MGAPRFIPGLELAGAFYLEVVRPLLGDRQHSAALLGWGSDVLGYDTERSSDHGWGPRLQLFVPDHDAAIALNAELDDGLPERFRGWPVRFGWDDVMPHHRVEVGTLADWLNDQLGVDARAGMSTLDWLLTPQQRLPAMKPAPR